MDMREAALQCAAAEVIRAYMAIENARAVADQDRER